MLSKEAESFLMKLRITLMERGKDDQSITEIEDELRDHLTEAEAHGHSVDDVTGGSVKSYINKISKEVPLDRQWIQYSALLLAFVLIFRILPRFFEGPFNFSLSTIIYVFITLGVLLLTWLAYKYFMSKWGVEWKIMHKKPSKSITFIIVYIAVALSILLFGASITKKYPIHVFATFSPTTSFFIGIGIVIIFLIIAALIKSKVLAFCSISLVAPYVITILIFGHKDSAGANMTKLSLMLLGIFLTILYIKAYKRKMSQK